MDVMDAAYHVVHDFPGGAQALGQRIGKDGRVLSAEVALNRTPGNTAKLGLRDALRIQSITGDCRILHAMAAQLHHVSWPLPDATCATSTQDAYAAMATLATDFGHLVATTADAVADGTVTLNEVRQVRRQLGQLVAAGTHLLGVLTILHGSDGLDIAGE